MVNTEKFLILFLAILPSVTSQKPITCNQSCPGGQFNPVPYPFGFSSGCEIQLNCTPNGDVLIGEFSVQQFNPDNLLVSIPAKCGRSVNTLTHLYSDHYAPMSSNAILMENCTAQMKNCMIPMTTIVDCSSTQGGDGNVSCYSSDNSSTFIDYQSVTTFGCRFLFSGVATEMIGGNTAISLDMQVVRLGWWLKGGCACSTDANCTTLVSPVDGSDGYRCRCKSGFVGNGYKASSGCRSAQESEGDKEGIDDLERYFYIGGATGFAIGFWIACGSLLVNRRGRNAFFHFLDCLKDWVYVKVVVCIAKLQGVAHP